MPKTLVLLNTKAYINWTGYTLSKHQKKDSNYNTNYTYLLILLSIGLSKQQSNAKIEPENLYYKKDLEIYEICINKTLLRHYELKTNIHIAIVIVIHRL